MIRFKNLLMPLCLVIVMGIFNSCGDDNDEPDQNGDSSNYSLIGKWLDSRDGDYYRLFNSDGYYEGGDTNQDDGVIGKWSLKEDKLSITITGEHYEGEIENFPQDEYEHETLYITWINENKIQVRQYEYDEDDQEIVDYTNCIWTRMSK